MAFNTTSAFIALGALIIGTLYVLLSMKLAFKIGDWFLDRPALSGWAFCSYMLVCMTLVLGVPLFLLAGFIL